MSQDAIKPLMFTVGLIDKISGPASRVTRSFDNLIGTAKAGFQDIGSGAMGLAATGLMIYEGLTPAIEMNRALADVRSAGIQEGALKQLNDTALNLAASYGLVATEVVNAGGQISRAIQGLSGSELSAFTNAAGVLATTTKANMEDTSRYISQMYERFQTTADAMGKAQWVEQLVGQTTYLRNALGTNTTDIADAMQGLNNLGAGLGVGMSEQLAVLATLSQSTGIADAEAQYTNFLEYAVSAQDKLGMSFVDSTGKLLPMMDILGKLQAEFGDLSGAKNWAMLDDAFGDGSKLIQQLSKDMVGLGRTMDDLGRITGMEEALEIAGAMTDPWAQLRSTIQATSIAFGQALLPAIVPVVRWMTGVADRVLELIQLFPNISKIIGVASLVVVGLAAGMATLTIALGVGKAALAGFMVVMQAATVITKIWTGIQWLLNAAFIASPIGLIVLGIAALIGVVAMAYTGLKILWEVLSNIHWVEVLTGALSKVIGLFEALKVAALGAVNWAIEKLNMIPGIEIESLGTELPYRNASTQSEVPSGGVVARVQNADNSDRSQRTNNITINTSEPMSPGKLDEYIWMNGS